MTFIDLHPVKCGDCRLQLVIGLDDEGCSWACCPRCKRARMLIEVVVEGLSGKILPPDASAN